MKHVPRSDSTSTDAPRTPRRRLLLTSLGTGDYSEVTYILAGRRATPTRLAPAAVCALLDPRPQHVGVLVTEAARARWFDRLAGELHGLGVTAEAIEVPEGRDEAELHVILERLTQHVAERLVPGDVVALDVTLALRHLPFVYLAALSYLGALRDVRLDGVYYAAHDLRDGRDVPLLDMTPLVALIDWQVAVRAARTWGDFRALAERLRVDAGRLFKLDLGDPRSSRAAQRALSLARATASGLPLEVGLAAAGLRDAFAALTPLATPLARPARLGLEALAAQTAAVALVAAPAPHHKGALSLDVAELRRQLTVAEVYVRAQAVPAALLVLREWLVNLVLHLEGTRDWLAHGARQRAERRLHGVERRVQLGLDTPDERAVGDVWQRLRSDRNAYAHAGYRPEVVDVSEARLAQHLSACHALLERLPGLRLAPAGGERVLITPFGLSRGVLFSAVIQARPERAVVVTSLEARAGIEPALARAGVAGLPCEAIVMRDPHYGFAESSTAVATPGLRALWAASAQVVVNLTGGTTAMAHVAERLGEDALGLGAPVRRIALIDRRPADEQRHEPYVLSEVVDLDGPA